MAFQFNVDISPYGEPDDRFITLNSIKHEISDVDPSRDISIGKQDFTLLKSLETICHEDIIKPITIPTGPKFMVWKTPWVFEYVPNTKVAEILEKRFIDKYGSKNTVTHIYQEGDKIGLFMITKHMLLVIYSAIISTNSEKVNTFLVGKPLYITGKVDPNMKKHCVSNIGLKKKFTMVPSDVILLAEYTGLVLVKSNVTSEEFVKVPYSSACNHLVPKDDSNIDTEDDFSRGFTLNERTNKIFNNIMNDVPNIAQDDIEEVYTLFERLARGVKEYGLDFSCDVAKGTNSQKLNIDSIMEKLTIARSQRKEQST